MDCFDVESMKQSNLNIYQQWNQQADQRFKFTQLRKWMGKGWDDDHLLWDILETGSFGDYFKLGFWLGCSTISVNKYWYLSCSPCPIPALFSSRWLHARYEPTEMVCLITGCRGGVGHHSADGGVGHHSAGQTERWRTAGKEDSCQGRKHPPLLRPTAPSGLALQVTWSPCNTPT